VGASSAPAAPAARRLASVPPGASREEVAAIVAALAVIDADERALAVASGADGDAERLDAWVRSARLSGRGTGYTRGSWRLAGRLSRRHRA
jgi:hypothetical protein